MIRHCQTACLIQAISDWLQNNKHNAEKCSVHHLVAFIVHMKCNQGDPGKQVNPRWRAKDSLGLKVRICNGEFCAAICRLICYQGKVFCHCDGQLPHSSLTTGV